jgi:hypothetical protein
MQRLLTTGPASKPREASLDRLDIQQVAAATAEWAVMLLPVVIYLGVFALGVYTDRPPGQLLRRARRHPLVASGPANMAGVLFAVSGFLLLGPPSWIVSPFRQWGLVAYAVAYASYVIVLALLGLWLMARQRNTLVLLNTNPTQFAGVLQDVLASLKLDYQATPGRVALADGRLVLDIATSFVWNNVILTWHGDDPELRQRVERQLRRALAEVDTEPTAAALLLIMMAAAILLFLGFVLAIHALLLRVL